MAQITLTRLAETIGGRVRGGLDPVIEGLEDLSEAREKDLAPFLHAEARSKAIESRAGALLVPPSLENTQDPAHRPLLVHDHPRLALARLIPIFHPDRSTAPYAGKPISDEARVHPSARIGAGVVVEPGVEVGRDVVLQPGCVVQRGASIGEGTEIGPCAVIGRGTEIGRRVTVGPGAVIGFEGFGYVQDERGETVPVPQVGRVVIEDDVSIGANATVDRATLGVTRIGRGARLDNLVHVAHNVRIGDHTLIAAQSGIAGSSDVGRGVLLGGQVGVADHVRVGDRARVAAKSGVARHVPPDETYAGSPAVPIRLWRRIWARLVRDVGRRA